MTSHPPPGHRAAVLFRWTARGLSLCVLAVLVAVMVGERFNPLHLAPRELALGLCFPLGVVAALLVAWRWELAGGLAALGSLLLFYVLHLVFVAHWPRGWAFAAFASPALLFLLAWKLDQAAPTGTAPPG